MKLSEIQEMATHDLEIDRSRLTEASIEAPGLVNKYYILLIEENRIMGLAEARMLELYKEKYDYYLGYADPKIYAEKPFNRKILKSDVEMYISADKDYTDLSNRISNQKMKIKYIEEIIKQVNQRSFIIRNIIANEKFKAGDLF